MTCSSGDRCLLHTKLVEWDQSTRLIEHRLQAVYGKLGRCRISWPSYKKPRGQRQPRLQRLIRAVSEQLGDEQPQSKLDERLGAQRMRALKRMLITMVPGAYKLDKSLLSSEQKFQPKELLPSYLADLSPICLGCVSNSKLIPLIDHLVRTRCISRLQRFGHQSTRAYFTMGSALLPYWQHMHRLQQSRMTSLVCPVVLPTSSSTNRMQLRSSVVVRGHGVKLVVPHVLIKSQQYRKQSTESTDTNSMPRVLGRQAVNKSKGKSTATHPIRKMTPASVTKQPARRRVHTSASSVFDESSADGAIIDLPFSGTRSVRDRSLVGHVSGGKFSIPWRKSVTAIYPVRVSTKPYNPFNARIHYLQGSHVKPLCFIEMPGILKKKWQLQACFNNIQITEQYHPQVLPSPGTSYTKERVQDEGGSSEPPNQLNSSKSKTTKDKVAVMTVKIPDSFQSRKHDNQSTTNTNDPSVSVAQNKLSNSHSSETNKKRGNLDKEMKVGCVDSNVSNLIQSCPDLEQYSSSNPRTPDINYWQAESGSALTYVKRPSTPPYTPVWAAGAYNADEIATDTVESVLSTFLSEATVDPSLGLPHPTPEMIQLDVAARVSNMELIDALALEWNPPHRIFTQNSRMLELVLPSRLNTQHSKALERGIHHIESPFIGRKL